MFPRGRGAGRGVRSREEEAGFPGEVAGSSREEVTSPAPYPGVEARRGNSARTRLQYKQIHFTIKMTVTEAFLLRFYQPKLSELISSEN